jgi:2-amino-4-hydroxy-6-hydroxymethyldihydropteridine diphosphokinase
MTRIYLGLGANLGDPQTTLRDAIVSLQQLPSLTNVRYSSLYASKPMGPADQPDYVNAVLSADTDLSPFALLNLVHEVEQRYGRQRQRRWGERTLDIDILLFGAETVQHELLQIPHPGLCQRDFVLVPLLQLEPTLSLPDGRLVAAVWQQLQASQPGHDLVKIS